MLDKNIKAFLRDITLLEVIYFIKKVEINMLFVK